MADKAQQEVPKDEVILEMKGICKSFGGIKALRNVNFVLRRGEVNVLLGENGAGKSTLIKIITGAYHNDEGTVRLFGESVKFNGPRDAQDKGIGAVYQEFNLIPKLTVYENIFIANQIKKGKVIKTLDRKGMIERSEALMKRIGANFDVTRTIESLGVAQRQMVEIAKALCFNSKLIIFDEPSAVLTDTEIEELMSVIRKLKREGVGIIYISHRLEEVFEIGDRVTVLRDGGYVGEIDLHKEKVSVDDIITMMVGRSLDEKFPKVHYPVGEEILKVEGLSSKGRFENVSFTLHKGEVLGFAGLVGAGRTEVAKTLFGAYPKACGTVYLYGQKIEVKTPIDAIKKGISYLSEDRKDEGLVQKMRIDDNMLMVNQKKVQTRGVFRDKLIQEHCGNMAEQLQLNTKDLSLPVSSLSGGNQQKVAIGKWLLSESRIMILDEPTRGVDVGAKVEIYNFINKMVEEGIGVIMISSELPEILGMSDRIIVMHEGRITGQLSRKDATQEMILKYATGQEV